MKYIAIIDADERPVSCDFIGCNGNVTSYLIGTTTNIKALEQTDVLEKIRAEIEEYKSRQLTLAIGVEDLEKGKQTALEYVLAILDKYKAESKKEGMTLEEEIKKYTNNAEYERTHGNLQGCLDFRQLAEWLKELKQLREQTMWIPVSERLPEQYKEVIVTDIETSDTYLSRYIGNGYWECDNGLFKSRIIAWQPKLKPYKAEREG